MCTHSVHVLHSYHHYSHHATSVVGYPVYTGFFFKIWDQLFDTNAKGKCKCVECRYHYHTYSLTHSLTYYSSSPLH